MITKDRIVEEKPGLPVTATAYSPVNFVSTSPDLITNPAKNSPNVPGLFEESTSLRFRTIAVAVGAGIVGLAYLIWRTLDTVNLSVWWVSVPLLLVEIQAFTSLLLFTFSLWDVNHLKIPRKVYHLEGRKVAVLIPTYNEGIEVLLPTVAAALALQPAHETWILDDGDRPEVAELALSLGARYLTRPVHSHAKAGNINHALDYIEADFIAVFDADHVASPNFLINTLGYFDDPKVVLVQTPQDFYNQQSFEHVQGGSKRARKAQARLDQHYHEQALFYRVIQAGKNRWNAAFWCGTNAIIRLAPLKEIGGLATETITEDIHTTIRFHRRGWKTVCHNEVLARGLAAATASQFQLQRYRWGTGAMQVLRKENPFFVSGLTLQQRLAYAATLLGWFESWRTLIYLVMPPVVLVTGVVPILADPLQFLFAFLLNYLLQQWAMILLGRGMYQPLTGTIFELVRLTPNLLATLTLFKKGPQRFLVTPKGRTGQLRQRIAPPRIFRWALGASGVAVVVFILRLEGHLMGHYSDVWVAYGAGFWLIFNSWLVWLAVRRVKSLRYASEVRRSVRFVTDLTGSLEGQKCTVQNASLNGVRLFISKANMALVPGNYQEGQTNNLTIKVDLVKIDLKVVLRLVDVDPNTGDCSLGCAFLNGQFYERAALSRSIFTASKLTAL